MPETSATQVGAERDRYAVPALERGLDIVEALARQERPRSLSEIAGALDLAPASIFRTLNCLERRGYALREGPKDLYRPSLRLFELSHASPPTRQLLQAALPEMRALAADVGQSCHLGTEADGDLLILADVESPRPVNLAFRLGARWPLLTTVSGRVILSHLPDDVRDSAIGRAAARKPAGFSKALCAVRERGYDMRSDETLSGVTDIGAPVVGPHGAVAALTLAFVRPSRLRTDFEPVIERLLLATARISRAIGGALFEGTPQ